MYLEGIVVCYQFDDYLQETLPHNKLLFDRLIVLVPPEDKACQKVCEDCGVECFTTSVFDTDKGIFRKGAGINEGLGILSKKDWVLHIDVDIWLPPSMRDILEKEELDKTFLYGAERYMVVGRENWERFKESQESKSEIFQYSRDEARLGSRFQMDPTTFCFTQEQPLPIGFFQMWNPEASGVKTYPGFDEFSADDDLLLTRQWPVEKRRMFDSFIVYHLAADGDERGANWKGRKTKRF